MDSHLFAEYGKSVDMGPWPTAGAKQPVHSLLRGKCLGIQQGMSVWFAQIIANLVMVISPT